MPPWSGFTIAELAVTIGVIGVIAAITMPLAKRVIHGIEFEPSSKKLQLQLSQTLETMNSDQTLTGYVTTAEFVDALQGYLRTVKVCHSENLTGCFPELFKAGEEEFSLSDVKGSEFMGKTDWETDVEGLILKNGFKLLIAYNPYCSKKNPQNCAAFLYDLNSIEKDNIYIANGQSDLGTFNATFAGGSNGNAVQMLVFETYPTVYCFFTNTSPDYEKYCGDYPSTNDEYWAGAKKVCDENGMKLPTFEELQNYCKINKDSEGFPTSGDAWTSDEYDETAATAMSLADCSESAGDKRDLNKVVCLSK